MVIKREKKKYVYLQSSQITRDKHQVNQQITTQTCNLKLVFVDIQKCMLLTLLIYHYFVFLSNTDSDEQELHYFRLHFLLLSHFDPVRVQYLDIHQYGDSFRNNTLISLQFHLYNIIYSINVIFIKKSCRVKIQKTFSIQSNTTLAKTFTKSIQVRMFVKLGIKRMQRRQDLSVIYGFSVKIKLFEASVANICLDRVPCVCTV